MLFTTTPSLEGRRIEEYLGIVTGEVILGAHVFKDLFAGVRDFVATSLPDPYPTVEGALSYDVARLQPQMHAGVGVQPSIAWLDIQAQLNWTSDAGFSAGAELTAISMFSLRGGMAYGQPTAGVGIDLRFLELSGATYSEPSLTNPDVLDRYWVVQLAAGF